MLSGYLITGSEAEIHLKLRLQQHVIALVEHIAGQSFAKKQREIWLLRHRFRCQYRQEPKSLTFLHFNSGRKIMLVLSRKVGEEIIIGDNIRLVVNRVSGNRVTIGIAAPDDIHIIRGELGALVHQFDEPENISGP